MIIDGRAIAAQMLAATRTRVAALGLTPVVRAITVAPNAATESYLSIKTVRAADAGMTLEVVRLPDGATEEEVIRAVSAPGADAVIVQLPLPPALDTGSILDSIPQEKDADVLSHTARAALESGKNGALLPPVVAAMKELFARTNVDAKGKKAVVVGKGWLVGEPAALWLMHRGASVSVLTRESGSLPEVLRGADIVVSGAGVAHLIKPEMLKPGVVLFDAGTSESDGTLAGDADPACAEVASVFTPVPGGVGPIAVACLFSNVAKLLTEGSS